MAEILPIQRTINPLGGAITLPGVASTAEQEITNKWKGQWGNQLVERIWALSGDKDPGFDKISGLDGYEEYASDLILADSKAEQDAMKAWIDRRKVQQQYASGGTLGIWADLMAGVADPANLIPIPAVKGIGFIKGALTHAGANAAIGGVTEALRQSTDPTAEASVGDAFYTMGIGALLGGAIGGPVGAWGASAARARSSILRGIETSIGNIDAPDRPVPVNFTDYGFERPKYERPPADPLNPGVREKIRIVEERRGWQPKEFNATKYAYDDNHGWIYEADKGRDAPRDVGEDVREQLAAPEPKMVQQPYIDDMRVNKEYIDAKWHDELQSYVDDGTPIESIVRTKNDFSTFRYHQHLWERELAKLPGSTPEARRLQAGKEAMKSMRASMVDARYAGNKWVMPFMDHFNRSTLAKGTRAADHDPRIADTQQRMVGDYGWAIKAHEYGHTAPPSVLLSSQRLAEPMFQKFNAVVQQQYLKMVSGDPTSSGKTVLNANVTAQLYAWKAGLRRFAGGKSLDLQTFSDMVGEAVFNQGTFSVNGFEVNEFARNAAKEFTLIMQEMDELNRSHGLYKDQTQISRDIQHYQKAVIKRLHAANKWLWGQSATPSAYDTVVRVETKNGPRIFYGENHEDAVANMIDELGDEGVDLADQLDRSQYGYEPKGDTPEPGDVPAPQAHGTPAEPPQAPIVDTTGRVTDKRDINKIAQNLGITAAEAEARVKAPRQPGAINPDFPFFQLSGRIITMVDVDGRKIPFYISTGAGGKKGVATGKWYPFFGFGPDDGWFNKGTSAEVARYYDSPKLRAAAEQLDAKWGDMRPKKATVPQGVNYAKSPAWMREIGAVDLAGMFDHLNPVNHADSAKGATFYDLIKDIEEGRPPNARAPEPAIDDVVSVNKLSYDETIAEPADVAPDMAPEPSHFVSIDDMNRQRVDGLSPGQRKIYNERMTSLARVEEQLAEARIDLKTVTDNPHKFVNMAGNPAAYFPRAWSNGKLAAAQDKAKWLFTQWFEIDGNPLGAEGRAGKMVDDMMTRGTGDDASRGGRPSNLNQRALNIPNDFRATHPEWGEIKASDFFETNALAVMQHYLHSNARRIETARMFGDPEMFQHNLDEHDYLMEKYYDPEITDEGRQFALDKIAEIEGYRQLSFDTLMGKLKERDPWAWDNEIANIAQDATTVTTMGRALLSQILDFNHIGMTQGFGTLWKTVFERVFDDFERHPDDFNFGDLTGELHKAASTNTNLRAQSMENGRPVGRKTVIGNWLHDRLPGYFKLNGMTWAETWFKDIAGAAAGHNIIRFAIQVGAKLEAGTALSKADTFRLTTIGISPREALLISRMPHEVSPRGLHLPAVHKWTGPDARAAREALLRGVHAEMRRAVTTPSIGDRSTVFNGVWTKRGVKTAETDLMKLPMQFLGYGVAANNKVLASMLQGRDESRLGGIFGALLMGSLVHWMKTPSDVWKGQSYDEKIYNGFRESGLGGFVLGDMNSMLERVSNNRIGLRPNVIRPLTGGKPPKEKVSNLEAALSAFGAAPGKLMDVGRAFWDPDATLSERAQHIRKAAIYGNILWWDGFLRDATGDLADTFGGRR